MSDNTIDRDSVYAKDDTTHLQASTTWSSLFPFLSFCLIVSVRVSWLKLVTWIYQDLKPYNICNIICIKYSWNVWLWRDKQGSLLSQSFDPALHI